jgi:hypothetical protein
MCPPRRRSGLFSGKWFSRYPSVILRARHAARRVASAASAAPARSRGDRVGGGVGGIVVVVVDDVVGTRSSTEAGVVLEADTAATRNSPPSS